MDCATPGTKLLLVPHTFVRGKFLHQLTIDQQCGAKFVSVGIAVAVLAAAVVVATIPCATAEPGTRPASQESNIRTFSANGVVKELDPDGRTLTVAHEAISNYMDAMTMPFKVREPTLLSGLSAGDAISFRLSVSHSESWIDQIVKTGGTQAVPSRTERPQSKTAKAAMRQHPLLSCRFTNELGQPVTLGNFRGQALAITFFFTRCPIPDYCPRLSKNFAEASGKLAALTNAPANWHFLSVSFDTHFDTPPVLKAYAEGYHYDPRHWSFLTGSADKIAELAAQADVKFEPDGASFNHNFRTLIIDAAGHLQTVFPIGGDLSDAIVAQIIKAAAVTTNAAPPRAS